MLKTLKQFKAVTITFGVALLIGTGTVAFAGSNNFKTIEPEPEEEEKDCSDKMKGFNYNYDPSIYDCVKIGCGCNTGY